MNTIEEGIANAHNLADAAQGTADGAVSVNNTQDTAISGLQTAITNINNKIGGNFDINNTVNKKIDDTKAELASAITLNQ
jgi:aconitase B